MSRPSLKRNLIGTVVSNLALPVSAIITGPILARALNPAGRGELAAVLAPIMFVAFLVTFGVPEALVYRVGSKASAARQLVPAGVLLGFVSGSIGAIAVVLAAPVLLSGDPSQVLLQQLLALTLPLTLILASIRGVLQGKNLFAPGNMERWITVAVRLVALVGLAAAGGITVSSASIVTVGAGLVGGVALIVVVRTIAADPGPPPPLHVRVSSIVSYGSRVWIGSLSALLILRVDQVLMVPLTTSTQLGFYAIAVSVAEVPSGAFSAIRDVLYARSTSDGSLNSLLHASRLSVLVFIPVTVAFVLVAPHVVVFAFGEAYKEAASMVQVLWIASLFSGVAGVAGAGLLSVNRPGLFSLVQGFVALANLAITVVLVPLNGGDGAALASLISYVLFAIGGTIALTRVADVRWFELWIARPEEIRAFVKTRR